MNAYDPTMEGGSIVLPPALPQTYLERELESLRRLYGKKFNAITVALGHVSAARSYLEHDEQDAADVELAESERILRDA